MGTPPAPQATIRALLAGVGFKLADIPRVCVDCRGLDSADVPGVHRHIGLTPAVDMAEKQGPT
jgi:hypothetical protein